MNDLKANLDMLKTLLGEIHRLHRDLLRESLAKKEAIIRMDIERMQSLTESERLVAESIRAREGLRQRLVGVIFGQYGVKGRQTLERLIQLVPESYQKAFSKLREMIRDAVKLVKRVNDLNRYLASQSLSHMQSILAILRGIGKNGPTYSADGRHRMSEPAPLVNKVI